MKSSLEHLLDACLTQLNNGADLEQIISGYPEYADELRPMLVAAALVAIDVPPPQHRSARQADFMAAVAQRRRMVEATDGYMVELKAGVPMNELMARAAPAMRPILYAAYSIYTTPHPAPSPAKVLAGKQHLMALAAARQQALKRAAMPKLVQLWLGATGGLLDGLLGSSTLARRAFSGAAALAMVSAVLIGGATGVTHAAASSLPGEPFYAVKRFSESAQLFLAMDETRRQALEAQFDAQRFGEVMNLVHGGRSVPVGTVIDWLHASPDALADVRQLPADQQRLMADALRDVAWRSGTALRGALANPATLDALLDWSEGFILRPPASAIGLKVGVGRPADLMPVEPAVSVSVQSPPAVDAARPAAQHNAPAMAAPAPPAIQAADVNAPAPMVQAADDVGDSSGSSDRHENRTTGHNPPGAAQPATDTATAVPPMVQPGDEPAPTPSPHADAGDSGIEAPVAPPAVPSDEPQP